MTLATNQRLGNTCQAMVDKAILTDKGNETGAALAVGSQNMFHKQRMPSDFVSRFFLICR